MRKLFLITYLLLFISAHVYAQKSRADIRPQFLKEDSNNFYKSDNISNLDLLCALDIAGIKISKFNLGNFDKKYSFCIMIDEYRDGKIVKIDTIFCDNNQYIYFEKGESDYYSDFIDQIKILTKEEESKFTLYFDTYKLKTKKEILLNKTDKRQFFELRNYIDTKWKLNQKISLMIYASSWEDRKHGYHRFCGVVNLSQNDEETEELLSSSPNYFVVSYLVSGIDK